MTFMANLSNLPPGVSERDLDEGSSTRLRCICCGGFLREEPESFEWLEDAMDCDGSVVVHEVPYDEALIRIIGEEVRGKSYTVAWSACGPDKKPHAPHRVVLNVAVKSRWTCRKCGTTREVVE